MEQPGRQAGGEVMGARETAEFIVRLSAFQPDETRTVEEYGRLELARAYLALETSVAALKSEREDMELMLRVELSDLYGHREFLGWQRVDNGWLLERCDTRTGVRSGVLTVPDNGHGIPALTPEARAALSGTRRGE